MRKTILAVLTSVILVGYQPNALGRTAVKIVSFCGGVRFPKADLAQVLLRRRPALRPPSTPDDLRGRCGHSVAHSAHSGPDSGSQNQTFADLLTGHAVVWGLGS